MINIVFESILKEKELHFNIQHCYLHRNEQSIIFVSKVENYYIIENNIKNTANVFITKTDLIIKFETFKNNINFLLMRAAKSLNTSLKLLKK